LIRYSFRGVAKRNSQVAEKVFEVFEVEFKGGAEFPAIHLAVCQSFVLLKFIEQFQLTIYQPKMYLAVQKNEQINKLCHED